MFFIVIQMLGELSTTIATLLNTTKKFKHLEDEILNFCDAMFELVQDV